MRLLTLFILALHTNASFALSLGEATLKSYLGEPLNVKLSVTDVEKMPDMSCFAITDNSEATSFKKANTSLSANKDGFTLTITTQSVITEPILNLRASYTCEPQLSRDYVLLLDPITSNSKATSDAITTQVNNIASTPKSKSTNSQEFTNTTNIANNTADTKPVKAKRKLKKRNAPAISSADQKMMEAYTGKAAQPTQQTPNNTPVNSGATAEVSPDTPSKPYLSISGGNAAQTTIDKKPNLNLQFATEIDINRPPPIAPVNVTDNLDEVTVMTNRLAHLEKQILSLQTQNTQLKNEAALAQKQAQESQSNWLNYLLVIIGIGLGLAALEWLRRGSITKRLTKQEQNWFNVENEDAEDDEPTQAPATTKVDSNYKAPKNDNFSESFLDDQDYDNEHIVPVKTGILSPAMPINDEQDSIIDNADVFIEHHRPQLAIQLLQNHLNDFPSESPIIWVKLLSLISTEGTEAEYEATTIEANKYFNIRVPSFNDRDLEDTSSIENFANIVARLEGVWGSPFAVKFLNDLIYDQYAQPAEGFTSNNFEELLFLKKIAELLSTGITTNQHAVHRTTANKISSENSSEKITDLDNLAFNEVAFGDDLSFDTVTPLEASAKPAYHAINDADFTVASLPDDLPQLNKPTKAQMNTQFENSAFQKVPSYDVDMLVDFDDLTEEDASTFNHPVISEITASNQPLVLAELSVPEEEKEFLFSPEVYPTDMLTQAETEYEITSTLDIEASQIEEAPAPIKSKDSNIIEWDLPELDTKK